MSLSTLRIETAGILAPLLAPARYKGAHGGRGASKSHFFADLMIRRAMTTPGFRGVCIRENQKSLAESVKRLLEDKIRDRGLGHYFTVWDKRIDTPGGGVIIFNGMQSHNAESIKSLEGYDVAWTEEAQVLSQRSLDMLRPTIRKEGSELWFSWNPRFEKDPVDRLLRSQNAPPGAVVVESNWSDNPWFPEVLRIEMEYDQKRDPDKYAHVWGGGYVVHTGAQVFKNWKVGTQEIPEEARPYYGADWGFSVDPTVLSRAYITGPRQLYIDAEVYKIGCEIVDTPELFDGIDKDNEGAAREWPITADSARPETISHMRRNGYPHIRGAIKGAGSVEEGVEFLKSYDITVHPDCKHTIQELTYYSYKVDKKTEEVLPVLADRDNNVIDSIRYAVEGERIEQVAQGPESAFVYEPSPDIPPREWPRVYGLDIQGAQVSAVWGAWDQHADIVWLYAEYVEDPARLEVWASAVRKRKSWIPGIFDQMARRRTQEQGERMVDAMIDEGLDIFVAEGDAEAAAAEVNARIATQQLKVASNLTNWLAQYRAHHRDKKGSIVQESEGLMHATGLMLTSGLSVAMIEPSVVQEARSEGESGSGNRTTGY